MTSLNINFGKTPNFIEQPPQLFYSAFLQPLSMAEGTGSGSTCAQNGSSSVINIVTSQGTSTTFSTTSLTDSSAPWVASYLVGATVQDTNSGGGSGTCTANTTNTVTISGWSGNAPANGHGYYISKNHSEVFNYTRSGNYVNTIDDFNSGDMTQWINDPVLCWGMFTTLSRANQSNVLGYPHTFRGWVNNQTIMQTLSANGSTSWTTDCGMGIKLANLTKCHTHWAITGPTIGGNHGNTNQSTNSYDCLIDVYFHTAAQGGPDPPYSAWLPQVDIQIIQIANDNNKGLLGQPAGQQGYWAYNLANNNGFLKTISGVQYACLVQFQTAYNQAGGFTQTNGFTMTMWCTPTEWSNSSTTGTYWGQTSCTHDIGGIITWLSGTNPKDDSNNAIKTADGNNTTVVGPLLNSAWYLSVVNAGIEPYFSEGPTSVWTTSNFWVAMQSEADGPSSP